MRLIRTVEEMKDLSRMLHGQQGCRISFVPTMGALHSGHAALIESAKAATKTDKLAKAHVTIVSIFVNPKQFNDSADFESYPSTLESDLEKCKKIDADYVFAPTPSDIYPDGTLDCVTVVPPAGAANQLEGQSRPGHFEGMLTVVCKLFNIVKPHAAYFGEKDYQQMVLVKKMVKNLNMDIDIRPVATVRDSDLLPLSSRNVRLTSDQREVAPIMCKILFDVKKHLEAEFDLRTIHVTSDKVGLIIDATIMAVMLTSLSTSQLKYKGGLLKVDYLELRCAEDLSKVVLQPQSNRYYFDCEQHCKRRDLLSVQKGTSTFVARLLISVIIGSIRLLDNVEVNLCTQYNS